MNLVLAVQGFFATLLLRAAWHKLFHGAAFREELRAYRLVPHALLPFAGSLLAVIEIACVFSLTATAVIFSIYTLAMGINLWRGNTRIDCGCGGWLSPRKELDYWLVLRNLLLITLAVIASHLPALQNPLHPVDLVLSLVMFTALSFLYEAGEQAIHNHQHRRQWQMRRTAGAST